MHIQGETLGMAFRQSAVYMSSSQVEIIEALKYLTISTCLSSLLESRERGRGFHVFSKYSNPIVVPVLRKDVSN